jgi:hypothetical protein
MEDSSINKETFIDRLEVFMKTEGLNSNSLTVTAGLSNGLVGKALKKRSSMNSDSIERILCAYTNLNADWLMTGRGNMYVITPSEDKASILDTADDSSLTFYLREKNKELEVEIRKVLEENASLRTKLELIGNSNFKAG